MAALKKILVLAGLCILLACDTLVGLTDQRVPLAALRLRVTGQLADVLPPGESAAAVRLRVALVWLGSPPLDRFCLKALLGVGDGPSPSTAALEVAQAGCRDVFGVAPARVAATVPVVPGQETELPLYDLPTADDLVGTPAGRFGYATLLVFDDRNGDGALNLRETERVRELDDRQGGGGDGPPGQPAAAGPPDFVYAASFWSMQQPSWRLVFREGPAALVPLFYPTIGCQEPAPGFTWRRVSGPPNAASCEDLALDATVVELPLQASPALRDTVCAAEPPRWRDPDDPLGLDGPFACNGPNELILLNPPGECRGLTTYALKGCRLDASCAKPEWDYSDSPPPWWPCQTKEP